MIGENTKQRINKKLCEHNADSQLIFKEAEEQIPYL